MQLYIGNKNYSSWSLRPWVLMTHAGIAFEEMKLRLDSAAGSAFKKALAPISPAARVPVLVDDGFSVWDTLAICEYLAEKFPAKNLWPQASRARARARSLCAEMHSGFGALRSHCPMNIEASLQDLGARLLSMHADLRTDLERIVSMWISELDSHGGPFLFGDFGIADAFFAPVVWRITTYGLPAPPAVSPYVQRMLDLPAMRAWAADARAEHDFLPEDEPYRQAPGPSSRG